MFFGNSAILTIRTVTFLVRTVKNGIKKPLERDKRILSAQTAQKTARGGEMTDTGGKLLYDLMFNLRFLLSFLSVFYHFIVSDNLGFVLLFEGFESFVFCGVSRFVDILNGSF